MLIIYTTNFLFSVLLYLQIQEKYNINIIIILKRDQSFKITTLLLVVVSHNIAEGKKIL